MLENLIPKKIFKNTGYEIESKDPFFQKNLMMITTSVVRDEIKNVKNYDTMDIVKINNIVIKECVEFFTNIINTEQEENEEDYSSKIEDIEDPIQELEQIQIRDDVVQPKELKPTFSSEILIFDSESTEANLKNIVSVEFVSCCIDFSDYIVTENNNCYCIDNEEKSISVGNYTPEQLVELLSSESKLLFKIDSLTDNITIQQEEQNNRKSMTASIKDKRQFNIDFGVKNSISSLLGFSSKTYILKEKKIVSENKHCIKHPANIKVNILFDERPIKLVIPTDVKYNETIHYRTPVDKKIKLEPSDIENVKITTDYNTRGRPSSFTFKFTKLD
jgi:hypothetical protein